jgi:hypothetical protein
MTLWDRWHREIVHGVGFAALYCVLRAVPDGSRQVNFLSTYYVVVAALLTGLAVRLRRREDTIW